MAIEKDLLDQLLAGRDPKDVFNKDGLVDELKKALSERILNAEIDEHLEGEGGEAKGNHRDSSSYPSEKRAFIGRMVAVAFDHGSLRAP